MSCVLVAELSTNHGGDVGLACDMVREAADAGATYVKTQSYSLARLNPADPQRAWLEQAHLDEAAHERIMAACQAAGIQFLSTPFDADSLVMLRRLGLTTFKIASSESGHDWWEQKDGETWFISYPWGHVEPRKGQATFHGSVLYTMERSHTKLTAIPLYPTPLEAVGRATLLEGWSDHTVGLAAAQWAIAQGIRVLEVHLHDAAKRGRVTVWDKSPQDVRQLRDFADACETMRTGVSVVYRNRWNAK
jgi:N,N'-diacetyllegionaminate synthase